MRQELNPPENPSLPPLGAGEHYAHDETQPAKVGSPLMIEIEEEDSGMGVSESMIEGLIGDFEKSVGGFEETYPVHINGATKICDHCGGNGVDLNSQATNFKCAVCEGTGAVAKPYIFRFRAPKSMQDVREYKSAATDWLAFMTNPATPKPAAIETALEGAEGVDLVAAFTMAYWSVDGREGEVPKMTDLDALKITKVPALADMILKAINRKHDGRYSASVMQDLETQKKS